MGSEARNGQTSGAQTPPRPEGPGDQWELRLYTAGQTPKSVLAFNNLKRICEEHMPGRYHIEVVDLMERLRRSLEHAKTKPAKAERRPAKRRAAG